MPDNTAIVPDYLLKALQEENTTGSTDMFVSDEVGTPQFRRIEFPQRTTTKWMGEVGNIIINDGTDTSQAEVVRHIDFLLVDYLDFNHLNAPEWMRQNKEIAQGLTDGYAGRTMWDFTEDGSRSRDAKKPNCGTPNGVAPWPSYRGKEVFDYRTKKTHQIGYRINEEGLKVEVANACIGCPFAQEIKEDKANNIAWSPAMCKQTSTAVIYDIDRHELMTLKGVNTGMQFAIAGYTGNSGRRYNNTILNGIRHPFSYTGDKEIDGVKVPVFRNRPAGKPTITNPNAPVYAVRMTVTQNNFSPATAIPEFTLLDGSVEKVNNINIESRSRTVDGESYIETPARVLTMEEYVAYLDKAIGQYVTNGWREKLMATNLITPINNNLPKLNAETKPNVPAQEGFDNPFSDS